MNKFRKVFSALLICLLVVGLAACGGEKSASEDTKDGKVTLSFWNGFTGSDGEILEEIVNEFNKTNDKGITIKMDIMAWANLAEKLPSAIATKTAPDFVLLGGPDFAQYVQNGAVQPLDDFFEVEGVDKSNFSPTSLDLGEIDGKQYYIPMQVQSLYMYWNKDLFTAAGLDPEAPPKTWDELAEMAPKLADASKNVSGFAVPKEGNAILYNWILNSGGTLADEAGEKLDFASNETLEVLKKVQKMIYEQKAGPESISGADVDNLMYAGQLAIEINGPWLNNGLKKNEVNYGVTTLPVGNDGSKTAILDGVGFAVPSSTEESQKEAVYEFVKYWNTTEIGKKWSMDNGFPPFLKSVAEDTEVKADPIVSELSKQIEYAEPFMIASPKFSQLNADIVNPMIEKLLAGEDPEKLMNDADKAIKDLLSSN